MRHDDTTEFIAALDARLEDVLNDLAPGWVRHGSKAYLTPKGLKDLGSFTVNVAGQYRGTWYRHSQQIGGGIIKLIAYLRNGQVEPTKSDLADAFTWARGFLGLEKPRGGDSGEAARRAKAEENARLRARDAERQAARELADRQRRQSTAKEIWDGAVSIVGTAAETYLARRKIAPPVPVSDCLRFHPGLRHPDGVTFCALVGNVQDPFGETVAVWRIFLTHDGHKAPVANPKLGLGPAAGGAVRIGGLGPHVGIAEGIESALSYWLIEGRRIPVWAGLSTSGVAGFVPPLNVSRVSVYPDGDAARIVDGVIRMAPGAAAAQKLAKRMHQVGIRCVINHCPTLGDGNDLIMGG